jgi:hypothetical protein
MTENQMYLYESDVVLHCLALPRLQVTRKYVCIRKSCCSKFVENSYLADFGCLHPVFRENHVGHERTLGISVISLGKLIINVVVVIIQPLG